MTVMFMLYAIIRRSNVRLEKSLV